MADKKLKVYHYAKCGTCRTGIKKLQAMGYELDLRDLFEQPASEAEIKGWLRLSGLELKKFFNTSGEVYKEQNLKDRLPGMSEEERIATLASNGRLVKRPVVTDGKTLTVGYKEDEFERVWG
ncbi:MAG TPA: Spx/MgsR family RNA polymerase-binding regulatory protein [Paenibacillus sp.]|uniref:Spx/MgsR family RNA polymerase-binding regulatory protein n=1 Tax=Paenibacillus sp. TaxID=58172 RepID=UPI002B92F53B|nr:Spx/MgsR family RNA polymerase-binding regulatory protein [Paenibacillus sp.]HUC91701.1 Spx/MgsR family RNA polymerase-binding regulatory protein [Paenibacillus sp.]